jgi:dihydrofolate reductase
VESVFIIGGAQVYAEALASPLCEEVYLTKVAGEHECDTFIPGVEVLPPLPPLSPHSLP